jgi:hypothetical protein
MAMQAPPERLAYVALLNAGSDGKNDAIGVIDLDPSSPIMVGSSGRPIFSAATMNCTTSAGTRAVLASALRLRIRTWSVGT